MKLILCFLSRHPLPIIGNNSTEKTLRAAIETENAAVLDRIKEETSLDTAQTAKAQHNHQERKLGKNQEGC